MPAALRRPPIIPELRFFSEWIARGYAGTMGYLPRSAARRADVRHVLPSARTVIVTATVYNTDRPYSVACGDPDRAHIARYAWGEDYHEVLGERLDALLDWMREPATEPFEARAYVDTGPVQERVYAQYAGLGWIGKNTCVIHPELGSWIFLAEIICSLPLAVGRAVVRSVRHLHALPGGVSDAGHRRARRARCDALYFLPDDRASRRRFPSSFEGQLAGTSTAATSARKCARGTPSRLSQPIGRGSRAWRGIGRV